MTSLPKKLHRSGKTLRDPPPLLQGTRITMFILQPCKPRWGREAKAPFPAPGGAGQAAKLCPPTMPLVSPGEHSLSKQTLQGRDRSCPQPASAQKPLEFLCQTHGSSELLLPIQALCLHQENVLNPSSTFSAAQGSLLSLTDNFPRPHVGISRIAN